MEEWLVVDGYNMIGTWPELRRLKAIDLSAARDKLIEILSEYAVCSGKRVVLVFDAHQVPGMPGRNTVNNHVLVLFTKKEETADECIERLVGELKQPHRRRLFVATSDYAEQRIIFGRGALRISARELLRFVQDSERAISEQVDRMKPQHITLNDGLEEEVKNLLERWRREHLEN